MQWQRTSAVVIKLCREQSCDANIGGPAFTGMQFDQRSGTEYQRVNGFYLAPPPRSPTHLPHLHRRLRSRAPPRGTRICAFLARKEGLGRAGRPRASWVVRRHFRRLFA